MNVVEITGQIVAYRGMGRQLGYPTANIKTPTELAEGVYFGFTDMAGYIDQPAIIFIGVPTTMGESERRIEVHALDIPDEDYYGQTLKVSIYYFHRSNIHFASKDELLNAMRVDEVEARRWFKENRLAKADNVGDT